MDALREADRDEVFQLNESTSIVRLQALAMKIDVKMEGRVWKLVNQH